MLPSTQRKAQSAMEYLMTYGWAILIIAVVLGALFSLGVFSGSSLLGNACIAQSGFLCQNPVYVHSTGYIQVQVGQNTGQNWAKANFTFVPQGTPTDAGGVPSVPFNAPIAVNTPTGLLSGQTQTISLSANDVVNTPVSVGVAATGAIWAQYKTTQPGAPLQYTEIATINIKAS
ncbi:MAG: hypothetical protein KGI06_02000 [Candidatus Micrarchaeota archaeon]|nr:hypothetical protein [Candidatus Micrarchaeota archaeon]